LEAGIELKKLTKTLCETNEDDFVSTIKSWYNIWSLFLKERATDPVTGKWHYTHRRLRSVYRSLRTNLTYLFTYRKHPDLNIPNTTNSLDGCFAYLKSLMKVHRGSKKASNERSLRRYCGNKSPKKTHYTGFFLMEYCEDGLR
jgi:hypothetical protein